MLFISQQLFSLSQSVTVGAPFAQCNKDLPDEFWKLRNGLMEIWSLAFPKWSYETSVKGHPMKKRKLLLLFWVNMYQCKLSCIWISGDVLHMFLVNGIL